MRDTYHAPLDFILNTKSCSDCHISLTFVIAPTFILVTFITCSIYQALSSSMIILLPFHPNPRKPVFPIRKWKLNEGRWCLCHSRLINFWNGAVICVFLWAASSYNLHFHLSYSAPSWSFAVQQLINHCSLHSTNYISRLDIMPVTSGVCFFLLKF